MKLSKRLIIEKIVLTLRNLQMEFFNHEGDCYLWMIPKLQALRLERNLRPLAFPKCFYCSPEESILILENMKTQGYDIVPKKMERKIVLQIATSYHLTPL